MKLSPQEKDLLGILALANTNTINGIADIISHLNGTKYPTSIASGESIKKLIDSLKTKGLIDKNYGLTKTASIQISDHKIPIKHAVYLTQKYAT